MRQKPVFYKELCYLFGILTLALGASMLVKANFGVSVVVSPAYLLHLKLSQIWPFFSFGLAEYVIQGTLLVLLILLVRRFHWSYLFSFATALFYGSVLDRILALFAQFPLDAIFPRILFYIVGLLFCAIGVALVLHTYISPEVYELLIREVSARYAWKLGIVKTVYDCVSCLVAVLLSFAFFGLFHFRGVGFGTLISALCSGTMVAVIGRNLERYFDLRPAFPSMEHLFSPPPFPKRAEDAPLDNVE